MPQYLEKILEKFNMIEPKLIIIVEIDKIKKIKRFQ
jgi:hypothetical protein